MARQRFIKPTLYTSEQLCSCDIGARFLFIGLINFSDDNGIHPASLMRAKMEIFPSDSITSAQIEAWIEQLKAVHLLEEYTVQDKKYWCVTGFNTHQNPKYKTFEHPLKNGKIPQNERPKRAHSGNVPGMFRERSSSGVELSGVSNNKNIITTNVRQGVIASGVIVFPKMQSRFDEFYEAYPRKQHRKRALQAWNKANCEAMADRIIDDVHARKQHHDQWLRDNGRYIPHPATYLNGELWCDEINIKPVTKEGNHAKSERIYESLADRAKRARDAVRAQQANRVFDNASPD